MKEPQKAVAGMRYEVNGTSGGRAMKYSDSELIWVFNRSEGRCVYCGEEVSFHAFQAFGQTNAWVIDRFIPTEHGGTDQIFNWVAACPSCAYHKGSRLPWEFDPDAFREGETKPEISMIRRHFAEPHLRPAE